MPLPVVSRCAPGSSVGTDNCFKDVAAFTDASTHFTPIFRCRNGAVLVAPDAMVWRECDVCMWQIMLFYQLTSCFVAQIGDGFV
jgi:hypothetical protein